MGNQQNNNKPGFYTPNTTPTQTVNNDDQQISSFPQLPTSAPAINMPTTNSLNVVLDEIENEIDQDYKSDPKTPITPNNNNSINASKSINQSIYSQIKLNDNPQNLNVSFVAPQNYLHKINDIFTYSKQLGSGASGRVLLVINNKTKKQYALKEISKTRKINKLLFINEYNILSQFSHKNIVKYIDSWIDKNCYYLATNYCSGGTMLDRIISQGHFSERECADFIKDVLMGIKYLHCNNIVHRDIKCGNLVFNKKGNDGILKIIDFGNSEIIKDKNDIDELLIGSLHYLSPEMLSDNKRTKDNLFAGDMWALGVVCYILVTGQLPFYGQDKAEILNKIKKGKVKWPQRVKLSVSCKCFVSSLLKKDINLRYNAQEALNHEWILNKATNDLFDDIYLSQIQAFHQANKLQKILINAVLSEMDKTDKKILLKAIRDADINGNRQINENDIINYILLNGSVQKPSNSVKYRAKTLMSQIRNGLVKMSDNDINKLPSYDPSVTNKCVSLNDDDVENILQDLIDHDILDDNDDDNDDNDDIIDVNTPTPVASAQLFDVIADDDSDDDDDNKYNYDDDFDINALDLQKQDFFEFSHSQIQLKSNSPTINVNKSTDDCIPTTSIGGMNKISVEKFSSLISKSVKDYDIDNLVEQLKPTKSQNILLSNITNFNLPLHSIQSQQAAQKQFAQKGLNDNKNATFEMID